MSHQILSLIGLLLEMVGFILIWWLGGLDGALLRSNLELKQLSDELDRLNLLKKFNDKDVMRQSISMGSNGAPIVGMVMSNTDLGVFLLNEIDTNLRKKNRFRKRIKKMEIYKNLQEWKRNFFRIYVSNPWEFITDLFYVFLKVN